MKTKIKPISSLFKTTCVYFSIVNMVFFLSVTKAGNIGSGGGGDADVIEFIKISDKLHNWIVNYKKNLKSTNSKDVAANDTDTLDNVIKEIDTDSMKKEITYIEESLNRPKIAIDDASAEGEISKGQMRIKTHKSRLEFISSNRINCYGIEKAACTKDGYIQISEPTWEKYSPVNKCEVVFLEMLVLMNIVNRYNSAKELSKYSNEIGCSDAVFLNLKNEMNQQKNDIKKVLQEKFTVINLSTASNNSFINELLNVSYDKLGISAIQKPSLQPLSDYINKINTTIQVQDSKFHGNIYSHNNYAALVLNSNQINIDYDVINSGPIQIDGFVLILSKLNSFISGDNKFFSSQEYEKFKLLINEYKKNMKRLKTVTQYLGGHNNDSEEFKLYKEHTDFSKNINFIIYSYDYGSIESIYSGDPKEVSSSSNVFFNNLKIMIELLEDSTNSNLEEMQSRRAF